MTHDVIVIGGGPAGYRAAENAAKAGMKTLCIEREAIGGVCLNEGCIPTKTLLYSAKLLDGAAHGEKYGVTAQGLSLDHRKVVARKNKIVKLLTGGVRAALKAAGAEVLAAQAHIVGREGSGFVIGAGEETYTCQHLVLATGSSAAVPPIPGVREGLTSGAVVTNREILSLNEVPERLVVIGGGVIGLEISSYFNSIGCEVTVIEMLDHIAGETDGELSSLLQKTYERRGVRFVLSARVTGLENNVALCERDGEVMEIPFDRALLSVGRRANTEGLGLENIGVELVRGAIATDDHMRTNVENVYAAGDVNGKLMLAHTAYREADVAINNILGMDDAIDYDRVPSVIYTNPELSGVGLTEMAAKARGIDFKLVKLPMRFSGRYLAENEGGDGVFKLLVDTKTHRVLGAWALCNYSSEFIASVCAMMEANMTVEQMRKVIFPHPTVCEIVREGLDACEF